MKPLLLIFLLSVIMTTSSANDSQTSTGLVIKQSRHTVADTSERLVRLIEEKGLTLFSRINHSANAKRVDLEMNPTEVILFGNPLVGTKLMQCAPTVAIDLPQKLLIWQDSEGDTQMAYNDPEYLKRQHEIVGCDEILNKIGGLLAGLTTAAAE